MKENQIIRDCGATLNFTGECRVIYNGALGATLAIAKAATPIVTVDSWRGQKTTLPQDLAVTPPEAQEVAREDIPAAATALGDAWLITSAEVREKPGLVGELSLRVCAASALEAVMPSLFQSADDDDDDDGEGEWSVSPTITSHQLLADQTPEVQEHLLAWQSAPARVRAIWAYINPTTSLNAALTSAEKLIAQKIVAGQDLVWDFGATATRTISKAKTKPTLANMGSTTAPTATGLVVNVPTGKTPAWFCTASWTRANKAGTYDGGEQWQITWS